MSPQDVIDYYVTVKQAAIKLKMHAATIYLWRKKGVVPELAQYKIEHKSGGDLKADKKFDKKYSEA